MAQPVTIWKYIPDACAIWIKIQGCIFGLSSDVFLAAIYLPPAGSIQLQSQWLSTQVPGLSSVIQQAQELGHGLLAGDFNAKISDGPDVNPATTEGI